MSKIYTQEDIKLPTARRVTSVGLVRDTHGKMNLYFSKDPANRAKAYAKKGITDMYFIDMGEETDRNTAILRLATSQDPSVQTILDSPDHFEVIHSFMEKNGLLTKYEAMLNIQKTEVVHDEQEEMEA